MLLLCVHALTRTGAGLVAVVVHGRRQRLWVGPGKYPILHSSKDGNIVRGVLRVSACTQRRSSGGVVEQLPVAGAL